MRLQRRLRGAGIGLVVALAASLWLVPLSAQPGPLGSEDDAPTLPARVDLGVALSDATLARAVARLEAGRPPGSEVDVDHGRIRVEALHHGTTAQVAAIIEDLGGSVDGEVPGVLVEGEVPFGALETLEASTLVDYLRPPLSISEPPAIEVGSGTPGEELIKTNADDWQNAGRTGNGVKVGIVDLFSQATWNAAQAAGEVPAPAGTFCRDNGSSSCTVWDAGSEHGVAVAEIVHDMAPDAQLYLASVDTTSDLQAAVTWFSGQGVDIVTRSLTAPYDGPGDGTGPIATVVDNAVTAGMTWFQSAGNNGGVAGVREGSYHRWTYADADADGFVEFAPGDELLGIYCGYQNGLRWNDFGEGAGTTDYDLWLLTADGSAVVANSVNDQTAGAPPIERTTGCPSGGWAQVAVQRYATGTTAVGDVLEFSQNGLPMEHWQNPYSASGPASDTGSSGALSVGAMEPWDGTTIADYSSQGPTNDGRSKPDLSAGTCVTSFAYSPDCFNGTSAATPTVAGGAALVLGAGLAATPAALRTWLLDNATVDRGAAGTDNVFGRGEFILPPPGGDDVTDPSVSITTPPDDATYALDAVVTADYTCADEPGGSGIDTCVGTVPDGSPVDTSGSGAHDFTVTATDNAGNTASVTHDYTVGAVEGPPNDDFADAVVLTGSSGTTYGTNVNAGKEPGEPNHAGTLGGASVWYRWTAPAGGNATVNTNGSGFDTVLAVYRGTSVNTLTLVRADDDSGIGLQSEVIFPATAGATYRIAIDGFAGASGSVVLHHALRPPNDAFSAPRVLPGSSGTITATNVGATKQAGEPRHAGAAGGASVWFRWTAPRDGRFTINTFGSSFDTLLAVYRGSSVGSLTRIAANDDAAGGLRSRVTFTARRGVTYRIAVDGYGAATGTITLHYRWV